jgi:hypothetical protein
MTTEPKPKQIIKSGEYKFNGRVIRTTFEYPPIPDRSFDWAAYFDDGDENSFVGRGATELEAVFDLLECERG